MASPNSAQPAQRAPVLRVTRYDLVSSFMIAVVVALAVAVLWLSIIWLTNRLRQTKPSIELELVELPGGFEDGAIGETLRLDSPEDVAKDPSLADVEAEETQVEETIENVIELSPNATQQVQQQWDADLLSTGKKGSADGTGRGPLGMGPGKGGMPREQRWLVRFSNRRNLEQYAKQLDFFGIQLGALMPAGQLIYLSKLAAKKPLSKRVTTGKGENRLYMVRQNSGRSKADVQLFSKAGIDVGNATIFHFYPRRTESLLARLEREYRNRPVEQIRRTYFVVRYDGVAYAFEVVKQAYFN